MPTRGTAAVPRRGRGRPKLEDVAGIETTLIGVALREFVRHGYGGTSMTRIVRAAGASKTTLYSRFASKEELFRAIMRQQIERLAASASFGGETARPELAAGLAAYAGRALDASMGGDLLEVNRLVYSEAQRFPELGALAAEATELGIAQVADFIARCARADGIACRDPAAPASVFIFMLRGWYINAMLTNRAVPADERRQWIEGSVRALVAGRTGW